MGRDPVATLHMALVADLLRCGLLGAPRPNLGNRYVVENLLGRGASGIVVSARDFRLGRVVALKLRVAGSDKMLVEEARALARLEHPNVVHVYDIEFVEAVLDGVAFRLWLVSMQHVAGRSLRAWLQEKRWTPDEVVRVFAEAGRGLAAAHDQNVVHRDFKPDNVMVRDDGVAMVLDFGFAITATSSQTTEGGPSRGVAGTDPYMAPEARQGQAGRRSDQFSFGVSLVEALTGTACAAGQRPPHLSRRFWKVVARSTAQSTSDRFEDMHALLAALGAERVSSNRIPNRVVFAATALCVVAIAASTFVLVTSTRHATPESSAMARDRDARREGGSRSGGAEGGVTGIVAAWDDALDGGGSGGSLASDSGSAPPAAPPTADVAAEGAKFEISAPDAGRRQCGPVAGTYHFRTIRRWGGRTGDVVSASYEFVLDENRRGLTASLARVRPRVDHLEVTLVRRVPDCAVWMEAAAESRRYGFQLRVEGGSVTGGFKATADPIRPDFSGDVESYAP